MLTLWLGSRGERNLPRTIVVVFNAALDPRPHPPLFPPVEHCGDRSDVRLFHHVAAALWREMIQHGVTGFLGKCDEELAHYTAMFAYDEDLRMRIVHAARERLINELASPDAIWTGWNRLFASIASNRREAA